MRPTRAAADRIAVIGAGPAGGYLARALALACLEVDIYDHSHPREKPCGGVITTEALHYLPEVTELRSANRLTDLALRTRRGRCIHATGIEGLADLECSSVQVIVLSCILEHEIAPLPLLRSCGARLAADGRMIVKVPNYACLARHLRGRRWCGYRWPDHVNYFTPATLAATARAAGLRVVRMNVMDSNPLSDSLYAVLGRDPAATCADEQPPALRLAV